MGLHLPRPVRPGDELHLESEVLEVRQSQSRPNQGLIKVRTTTLNQNDEAVQVLTANLIAPANVDGTVPTSVVSAIASGLTP